jgi:DNA-binding response OmpR family regulator
VRVLIVDDEADYRYLMVLGLNVEGHEVILVDLVLVGESGVSLLPRLRQAAPEAAVVLHTVERERAAVMVGHPSGPDGLLEKGIPPRQLSEALAGIVAVHRARNGSHERY